MKRQPYNSFFLPQAHLPAAIFLRYRPGLKSIFDPSTINTTKEEVLCADPSDIR